LAKNRPKIAAQFTAAEREEAPFAIILGGDELKQGLVTVKEQVWELKDGVKVKIEDSSKGTSVKRSELIQWIKQTETFTKWTGGKFV
jgi:histidyl-tRNA synthetase